MIALVIVMLDKGIDLILQATGQIIIFEQDPVFRRLMPTLDFALGLQVSRRAFNIFDVLLVRPIGEIGGDIAGTTTVE